MDEFFDYPLWPLIETTRGCPFKCSFCADGVFIKTKIKRFETSRVKDEIDYIAARVKKSRKVEQLGITDLNFGMYKEDLETAEHIAKHQKSDQWPSIVSASAGKNRPERLLNVAKELRGSWHFGSAIQSSDEDVLDNINRKNISVEAYNELLDYSDKTGNLTYTEIILGLPGDTKEKHFNSLKYGLDHGANQLRMYQAILLAGTEMASDQTRKEFQILSKFRVIPGSVGRYKLGNGLIPVCEIEEIIVQTKDLTFDEYISCRIMHLIIETFFNGSLFEEVFNLVEYSGLGSFEILKKIHDSQEKFPSNVRLVLRKFINLTKNDLYESYSEAKKILQKEAMIDKHLNRELGVSELLTCRADLYLLFEDITNILFDVIREALEAEKLLTSEVHRFLQEMKEYLNLKKKDFHLINNLSSAFLTSHQAVRAL